MVASRHGVKKGKPFYASVTFLFLFGATIFGETFATSMLLQTDSKPLICIFVTGHAWDPYPVFALQEVDEGRFDDNPMLSRLRNEVYKNDTIPYRLLYADAANSPNVVGEALNVFIQNKDDCSIFVGPAWTSQVGAFGELATYLDGKVIVTGGATSPRLSRPVFSYVTRVIPSDYGLLEVFAQLIVAYEIEAINIVYYNDLFGQTLAESMASKAEGKFIVSTLQSFSRETTKAELDELLNGLAFDSPTNVTFLAMSVLHVKGIMNAAGSLGMHENHLWLGTSIAQVALSGELDPPIFGGAWTLSYGEDLVPTSDFAIRYRNKNLEPYMDAQARGFFPEGNLEDLTYFGSYGYDAALAALHGLAALYSNVSNSESNSRFEQQQWFEDGPSLLDAVKSVSFQGVTGQIQMDTIGDRIGARIPIFSVDGVQTLTKFAVNEGMNVTQFEEPLWPGGRTKKPEDLVQLNPPPQVYRESNSMILVLSVLLPLSAVVISGSFLASMWWGRRSIRDVRLAPKEGPCCIIFTDIQASSLLWASAPEAMSKAVFTHHSVIRSVIAANHGYEVKTIGDAFMIACGDPAAALNLAIDLQVKLHQASWDQTINDLYYEIVDDAIGTRKDDTIWKGLRVRVGIHYGMVDVIKDEVAKGYDYYGALVNETARIEHLGHGGQTIASDAFLEAVPHDSTARRKVEMRDLGTHDLRGCQAQTKLWQLLPRQFRNRRFPPLRTNVASNYMEADGEKAEGLFSNPFLSSDTVSACEKERGLLTILFSVFKKAKRKEIVSQFCTAWHVKDEVALAATLDKVHRAHTRRQLLRRSSDSFMDLTRPRQQSKRNMIEAGTLVAI